MRGSNFISKIPTCGSARCLMWGRGSDYSGKYSDFSWEMPLRYSTINQQLQLSVKIHFEPHSEQSPFRL